MTSVPTTADCHRRPSAAAAMITGMWLGRAREADVANMRCTSPLLDTGPRPEDRLAHLSDRGLGDTPRPSCRGCHSDGFWQRPTTESPAGCDDAVAVGAATRRGSARANTNGHRLRGTSRPHPSRRPCDQVRLRPAHGGRATAQGCGRWSCPAPAAGQVPGEVA